MGNTFTVKVWGALDRFKPYELSPIDYWQGDSFIQALLVMRRLRRLGHRCITLEWRPR